MSDEDSKKRIQEMYDRVANINKLVKTPAKKRDETTHSNTESSGKDKSADIEKIKKGKTGKTKKTRKSDASIRRMSRTSSSNTKKKKKRKSRRSKSSVKKTPHIYYSKNIIDEVIYFFENNSNFLIFVYFLGSYSFFICLTIEKVATSSTIVNKSDINSDILVKPFIFSLIYGILIYFVALDNEVRKREWIWFHWLISIITSIASFIIVWKSSFNSSFIGQILLIIFSIGPIFGAVTISINKENKIAEFCFLYYFLSIPMLICIITLSTILDFSFDFMFFFFLLKSMVGALLASMSWPIGIFTFIILGLFHSFSISTLIGSLYLTAIPAVLLTFIIIFFYEGRGQ